MRKPFTQLDCHLVWSTWDRMPLIAPEMETRLDGAITAKITELREVPLAVGGVADHIHVVCSFHPTIAIAYLVQQIKGSSSHLMTHEFGADTFKWQGAYGAFTVARDALEPLRGYVMDQKERHRRADLWPEWEHAWLPDSPPPSADMPAPARERGPHAR